LVQKAWESSVARVEMNQKAIVSRGWGPRALNYHALLHPKKLTSKVDNHNQEGPLKQLASSAEPEELTLSEGVTATLVDRIVVHKNKEASHNGVDATEQQWKQKATAELKLCSQEKRILAGLLAAAGRFQLNSDVRDYVQLKAVVAQEKEYEKFHKRKHEYEALSAKVQSIRNLNLHYTQRNQAQSKVMLRWFKRDGDDKLL
jgi:hypothetical protein